MRKSTASDLFSDESLQFSSRIEGPVAGAALVQALSNHLVMAEVHPKSPHSLQLAYVLCLLILHQLTGYVWVLLMLNLQFTHLWT